MAEYYDLRRKARATGAWAAVPGLAAANAVIALYDSYCRGQRQGRDRTLSVTHGIATTVAPEAVCVR
jgi:hypothetical protein